MSESLYSIILDWGGGTYISQIKAANNNRVIEKWLSKFNFSELAVSEEEFSDFYEDCKKSDLITLEDLKNIWCITSMLQGKLALINIIETNMSKA